MRAASRHDVTHGLTCLKIEKGTDMHTFDPEIAKQVGLNAAVIYQNIVWWTQKNAANDKHCRDGLVWTYNSRRAFSRLFPYLTDSQIKTALEKLVHSGLLVKGDYNQANYDRTNWYSPAISGQWVQSAIGEKSPMDEAKIANGLVKNRQPIPDSKPVDKPVVDSLFGSDEPHESSQQISQHQKSGNPREEQDQAFEQFWSVYPRRVAKGDARKAWKAALKKATAEQITFGARGYAEHCRATSTAETYIAHPATWLNGERWSDHKPIAATTPTSRIEDLLQQARIEDALNNPVAAARFRQEARKLGWGG
jgi:hypothetical protein